MSKKPIKLTVKERADLERYCGTGVHNVRLVNRANILLALDTSGGRTAERQVDIAQRLGTSHQTVTIARRTFLSTENLATFLQRKSRQTPPVPAKISDEREARIIALACGPAPTGYARWTLRLLATLCPL